MKEKLTKFIKSPYFPFALLLLSFILRTIKIDTNFGDDVALKTVYMQKDLWTVLVDSYNSWSSPNLINAIMYVLVLLPSSVFKIFNILMIMLTAFSISQIANPTNNRTANWMITILIILYPFKQMSTAGWIVTSVAYLFPLAFGLYSLIPIRKVIVHEKVPYVTGTIAFILGAGSLQMACILTGIYIIFSIYFVLIKKASRYCMLQSAFGIAFIIYHSTSPGNRNRYISETATWFPDFNMISTLNKVKLGFTNTLANFLSTPNLFFIIFCVLLFIGVYIKYKDILYRLIAAVPLAATLLFGSFNNVFSPIFPELIKLMNVNNYDFLQITTYNFISKINYIPIILGVIIVGCILLAIYLIFENTSSALLVNIIFLAGTASRMIMSFSPTLYASSTRTFIFMYFSIIVCGIFIFDEIIKYMDVNKQSQLLGYFGAITLLYYIESFITI